MTDTRRWHMNRMGFVNFWLYDQEVFSFSNGKLLLRGQNASGKSITTQSFIPFILDGDRTPSRLDPFGSNDRKMEYYFLGDDERDDVTAYLYLEFKREGEEEYRTIGIGQRAQRGKSGMGFWGFVILDGRRVGEDLELVRSVGNQYIPLSRQELKNLLGDGNFFTETQKDYMAAVNRYLFGFERLEQYEQFIRLLIKVRAPKLSKEFKPSKVYEILDDSLQTLTDEDLRAMVDAMEKMDDIEITLGNLRKAARDLKVITEEYRRYNEFILGKKAEQYLNAKEKSARDSSREEELKKRIGEAKEQVQAKQEEENALEEEIRMLESRMEAWNAEDLKKSVAERASLRKKAEDTEAETQRLHQEIERRRDQVREKDAELHFAENDLAAAESDMEDAAELLCQYQEVLQFEAHEPMMALRDFSEALSGHSAEQEFRDLLSRLQKWNSRIRSALRCLENQEKEEAGREEEERKKDLARLEAAEAKRQRLDAQQLEDNCKDEQVERLHICRSDNRELLLNEEEFERLRNMILQYSGNTERSDAQSIWFAARERRERKITEAVLRAEAQKKETADRRKQLEAEWEELLKVKELSPARREAVKRSREALQEEGIPCAALYEVLDFREEIPECARARMEKALEASGLLDALLVPEKAYDRAAEIVQDHADTLIRLDLCRSYLEEEKEESGRREKVFLPAEGITVPALRTAASFLCESISSEAYSPAPFILTRSGFFRNGLLEGYAEEEEGAEVRYLGAENRRQRLERQKEEKRAQLEAVREEENLLEARLQELAKRREVLQQEYGKLPDMGELEQAHVLLLNAEKAEGEANRRLSEQEEKTEEAKARCRKAASEVIEACQGFPYPRKTESFREAEEAGEEYRDQADFWHESLRARESCRHKAGLIRDSILHLEEHIDELDQVRRQRVFEARNFREKLEQLERMLTDPDTQKLLREMEEAEEKLREDRRKREDARVFKAQLLGRLEEWEASRDVMISQAQASLREKEMMKDYLLEEAGRAEHRGTLFRSGEEDMDFAGLGEEKIASRAMAAWRENDRNRSEAELLQNLLRIFQAHFASIAEYGAATEDCFPASELPGAIRKRQILTAVWQGNRLPIASFHQVIRDSIEATEMLIQRKDRELFEDILSDTLSRKLTARIHESRSWIRDMSKLMQQMDTSMGLTFSLKWSPRSSEGEGQLGADELERILSRDKELLSAEDVRRVAEHFRSAIRTAKQDAMEKGETVNYREMVRDALDYRRWFEFRLYYHRPGEAAKELTDRVFNRFSGGEKAMAMYVPLFAAVNAQYRKSGKADHPRVIALDEAFAGVDDKNISSMFELVETLDFDYIMNSQILWGCYDTVPSLQIAELLRPENSPVITVIFYHWNGKKKVLL